MRLRLIVPKQSISSVLEKIDLWNSVIVSRYESRSQLSIICDMEPGIFQECDSLVRNLRGRLDILAVNVRIDGESLVYNYDDLDFEPLHPQKGTIAQVSQLCEKLKKQDLSAEAGSSQGQGKRQKCITRQVPLLSAEEC